MSLEVVADRLTEALGRADRRAAEQPDPMSWDVVVLANRIRELEHVLANVTKQRDEGDAFAVQCATEAAARCEAEIKDLQADRKRLRWIWEHCEVMIGPPVSPWVRAVWTPEELAEWMGEPIDREA